MSSRINNRGNGNLLSTLDKVIKSSPITPQIFFECLVPVAIGARPAALAFLDQLDMSGFDLRQFDPGKKSVWLGKITEAANSYLGVNPFFLHSSQFPKIVFYKDPSLALSLTDLNKHYSNLSRMPRTEINEAFISIAKEEGSLLGIPSCCINSYTTSARGVVAGHDIVQEVKTKFQLSKLAKSAEQVRELDEKVIRLFWAMEVSPCNLSCENSLAQGEKILRCFGDEEIARMYQNVMMTDYAVWAHGYVPPLFEVMASGKPLKFDYAKLNREILEALH